MPMVSCKTHVVESDTSNSKQCRPTCGQVMGSDPRECMNRIRKVISDYKIHALKAPIIQVE